MKKISIFAIATCLSFVALAHEFWLEPQKFVLKVGEKINFRVFVGENFTGEKVDFTKFKITKFTHISEKKIENKSGNLTEKDLVDFLKFDTEGNHLIAFNNTNKFIELDAPKFNEYLKDDGLDNVLKFRKEKGELNKKGREMYQRCVKTLLQVGSKYTDAYKQDTGMRLELIPDTNPYNTKANSLTFNVLFDKQPLQNALVVVWQKGVGKLKKITFRSNTQGKISFPFTQKGIWMISVVKMIENPNKQESDWQSYWGSYTFGFMPNS